MSIVVVAHNIRSIHNIGSIFRTCDGFGVEKLWLSGYSPYPTYSGDDRPPHIRASLTQRIHKTALGAEQTVPFAYTSQPHALLQDYAHNEYVIAALEQTPTSQLLQDYTCPEKLVLILGEEVNGIEESLLALATIRLEIPMVGQKESFNVSVAAGIALYGLRYG